MRIRVCDLKPNPFRNFTLYPIQRDKVEALKVSIRSTGFWDNLLVRQVTTRGNEFITYEYQIAYGHHRLKALQELVDEQVIESGFIVDVPVRKLDDATMLRIMAHDNGPAFKMASGFTHATTHAALQFLHRETQTPIADIRFNDISQFLGGIWYSNAMERHVKTALKAPITQ